jgi:hypothetical protein
VTPFRHGLLKKEERAAAGFIQKSPEEGREPSDSTKWEHVQMTGLSIK